MELLVLLVVLVNQTELNYNLDIIDNAIGFRMSMMGVLYRLLTVTSVNVKDDRVL
jgi:hypothetical protein